MFDFKFNAPELADALNQKIQKAVDDTLLETLELVETLLREKVERGVFKPLALATVRQRLALGYSATPPLIRSETLLNNFAALKVTKRHSNGIEGYVYPNSNARAPYSKVPIGEYMEALNRARPFMELTPDDRKKVSQFFEKRLAERLGE